MSKSSSQDMAWSEYTPPKFLHSRIHNGSSEKCMTCGSPDNPSGIGEDIIPLLMLNEFRDAEDKVERDQAKLERDRATLKKRTADFEAEMMAIRDHVFHGRRLEQGEQRAFERQRLEILETLQDGREALGRDRIAYWADVHAQSEARDVLEKGKAALERAEAELRLAREAFEREKRAVELAKPAGDKTHFWKRVSKWLERR